MLVMLFRCFLKKTEKKKGYKSGEAALTRSPLAYSPDGMGYGEGKTGIKKADREGLPG